MSSALLKHVREVALKLGASDVATEYIRTKTYMMRIANNEISVYNSFSEGYVSVYVVFRERRAMAGTSEVRKGALSELVKRVSRMALESPPSDVYAPLPHTPLRYEDALLKPTMRWQGHDKMVEWAEAGINSALKGKVSRVAGSLYFHNIRRTLQTTGCVEVEEVKNCVELSLRAFVNKYSSGQFATCAAREEDFRPEMVGDLASEIATLSEDPSDCDEGVYDAVIGPMTTANLLEEVGYAASAYLVDAQSSFLTGKLGSEVTNPSLSLADDPTVIGSYGSTAFDAEGLPTRRTSIIKEGRLVNYLHNSWTAKKFGTESTANAGLIVPHPFNLVVEGEGPRGTDLISKVDKGIFITNDWYLRYHNMRSGSFSTLPRDGLFLIKNGSIERPIKGLRLSDNILSLLKNIEAISSDKYWIKWWEVNVPVYAPYLLVRGMRFTKSVT
ncbi:MAG: TldD/PmbA family protein [Aigarchaeota archaeon]|nr:TldD/PmbA family protein [Aigarchaeota archaeon]MDW8093028.1 TldD/PmbA family protein [Nitrososphaerota archaeon]